MKKIKVTLISFFLIGYSSFSFSYVECLNKATVTELESGRLTGAPGGEDAGNAVRILTNKGQRFLPKSNNLNYISGRAMFSSLQIAMALRLPISAWGKDQNCSDGMYHVKLFSN